MDYKTVMVILLTVMMMIGLFFYRETSTRAAIIEVRQGFSSTAGEGVNWSNHYRAESAIRNGDIRHVPYNQTWKEVGQ